jgi:hypothetical protein
MSVKQKVWDIRFTLDFSRLFVKPLEDKNSLFLVPIFLLLSPIKSSISKVQITNLSLKEADFSS